jgi:ATP-dependent Clp protease ATP-binding subunit ClpB
MDVNKFTQKSQEALTNAQNTAVRFGHAEMDVEHLLLALIEQADGLVPRLIAKMDVLLPSFAAEVIKELERRPKVSGPGAEPGKILVSQRLGKVLVKAKEEAARLKDEYVSVEHLDRKSVV